MTNALEKVESCLCCGESNLIKVLKLKDCPLTDNYQKSAENSIKLVNYNCELYFCPNCTHLQLGHHVRPDCSYLEYQYQSATTVGLRQSFENYAVAIKDLFIDKGCEMIDLLDIGSNDGSFLKSCRNHGINACGIEPALKLVELSKKNGLRAVCGFFEESTLKNNSRELSEKYDIVTFNNVLANISSPNNTLKLAKSLLKDKNSRIIIQTGYHPAQFSSGLFDYIYHEHYSYFSVKSMQVLAGKVGLTLERIEESSLRGGSIRFYLKSISQDSIEKQKNENIIYERFNCITELEGLENLVDYSRQYIGRIMTDYRREGFNIIGFGASHSTGMLVHTLQLENTIDYIVDENPNKFGLYMPGTKLIVRNIKELEVSPKTIIIILAWQYYSQIKKKLIDIGFASNQIIKPILP